MSLGPRCCGAEPDRQAPHAAEKRNRPPRWEEANMEGDADGMRDGAGLWSAASMLPDM